MSPPDRIVGELLQPGGVAALRKLGMGDCLEGIDATPVEGYCVYMQGKEVPIPYPTLDACVGEGHTITQEEKSWSRSGKKEGRSFHHGRFIDALRQKVLKDAPNVQVLEGTVANLVTCDHTTKVIGVNVNQKIRGESVQKSYYAPLTIIADGCFSKFRKAATMSVSKSATSTTTSLAKKPKIASPVAETKTKSHFIGLVIKDVTLPKAHHGTVCLTPAGPVLLYQIADEARETRLLVDVKGALPSISDGSMKVSISGCARKMFRGQRLSSARLTRSRRTSRRNTSRIFHPRPASPSNKPCRPINCVKCPTRSSPLRCRAGVTVVQGSSWSAIVGTCVTRSPVEG